jgi:hypothetical protein
MEPMLRVASELKCIEDGGVEVTERPDGSWMWGCSLHGAGADPEAMSHKTQADAEAEAEWVHIVWVKTLARMYIAKMREELKRRREKGE